MKTLKKISLAVIAAVTGEVPLGLLSKGGKMQRYAIYNNIQRDHNGGPSGGVIRRRRPAYSPGFNTLKKAANVVQMWLRDTHNFTPGESDESEKVYMTGWQYIGFGLVVAAVCVLLSIRF